MSKRKLVIVFVLLLVIGFASISATLIVSGVINFASNVNDFEVFFYDAAIDKLVSPKIISADKKSLNYETNFLSLVDDTSTLDYTVMNNSSQYDANISVSCTNPDTDLVEISYEPKSLTVKAGKKGMGTISVKLKAIVTEDEKFSLTCNLVSNAIERTSAVKKVDFNSKYDVVVMGDSVMNGYGNDEKSFDEYLIADGLATNPLKLARNSSMLMYSQYVDERQLIFDYQITKALFGEAAYVADDAIIIFNGGINDIVFNFKYPAYELGFESVEDFNSPEFFENIMKGENLMSRIYNSLSGLSMTFKNATIIYIKPRLLPESADNKYYKEIAEINKDIELFNAGVDLWEQRIGKKYSNVHFINSADYVTDEDMKEGDAIHWSSSGYENLYQAIKEILE